MTNDSIIDRLNAHRPHFFHMLGGSITALDPDRGSCSVAFDVSLDFCHSVDIVQGGFVTTMLDIAMTHAVFGVLKGVTGVASLEVKVSFLEPSRAGCFTAVGAVLRPGRSTCFLTGELFNESGILTATATSTAKLLRGTGVRASR